MSWPLKSPLFCFHWIMYFSISLVLFCESCFSVVDEKKQWQAILSSNLWQFCSHALKLETYQMSKRGGIPVPFWSNASWKLQLSVVEASKLLPVSDVKELCTGSQSHSPQNSAFICMTLSLELEVFTFDLFTWINSWSASHDNWCTVGGDGGCRVGEVQAGTTSPIPDHNGFKLQ